MNQPEKLDLDLTAEGQYIWLFLFNFLIQDKIQLNPYQ